MLFKPTLFALTAASALHLAAALDKSPACDHIEPRDALDQQTQTLITTTITNVAVLTLGGDSSATYAEATSSEDTTVLLTCATSTKTMTSSKHKSKTSSYSYYGTGGTSSSTRTPSYTASPSTNITAQTVAPFSGTGSIPLIPVATTTPYHTHGPCNCTAEGSIGGIGGGHTTLTTTSTATGTLTKTNATVAVNGTAYSTGAGVSLSAFTTASPTHTQGYSTGAGSSSAAASATEATQNVAASAMAVGGMVGKLLGAVAVGMVVVG